MSPKQFLYQAMTLVAPTIRPSPVQCRTAVSRAYYAAFHVAVNVVSGLGVTTLRKYGGHEYIVMILRESKDVVLIKTSEKLGSLKDRRVEADYRLDLAKMEIPANAQSATASAGQIIKELEEFEGDGIRKMNAAPLVLEYVKKVLKIQT
jgi:uncharacterized protein (UPF0332 family)